MASLHELELTVTLAGALTVLLLLLVIRIAASTLARPLRSLAEAAGRISQGELEVELPELNRTDEVGELRDAFERMVRSLRGQFERARAAAAASERIRRDFELAREIQLADPSARLPLSPDVELYGRSLPAREVGGDVYDYFWVSSRWVFLYVADVEGKGVPAALHTVLTRRLLRALAKRGLGVAACLDELNEVLNQEEGRFVTLFLTRLDVVTGELCYASAGHDGGWVLARDGKLRALEGEPGLPLGIQPTRYSEQQTRLLPGEGIYLATDGLGEARNAQGEFFGPRLEAMLELRSEKVSASDLVQNSLNSVLSFLDGAHQQDDLTVAALVFHGPVSLARNSEKISKSNNLFERTPAVLEEFLSRPA
jgi:sigma-B regulation protein RsbU (phosphoserine phosphatase)